MKRRAFRRLPGRKAHIRSSVASSPATSPATRPSHNTEGSDRTGQGSRQTRTKSPSRPLPADITAAARSESRYGADVDPRVVRPRSTPALYTSQRAIRTFADFLRSTATSGGQATACERRVAHPRRRGALDALLRDESSRECFSRLAEKRLSFTDIWRNKPDALRTSAGKRSPAHRIRRRVNDGFLSSRHIFPESAARRPNRVCATSERPAQPGRPIRGFHLRQRERDVLESPVQTQTLNTQQLAASTAAFGRVKLVQFAADHELHDFVDLV